MTIARAGLVTWLLVMQLARSATARTAPYHLALEAATDFPADVGGRLTAELPWRLRLTTSLGVLPGGYVDVINAVVVGLGGYNQSTADLVRTALQNSLVWRLHAGWRPFERLGLYVDVGYGLAALGGSAAGDQIISAATGRTVPTTGGRQYDLSSTLHMVDVEIGWEWALWGRLSLRAAVGGAFTLGASTSMTPKFPTGSALEARGVQAFTSFGAAYLDHTYTSYVHAPLVTVAVGYRFF